MPAGPTRPTEELDPERVAEFQKLYAEHQAFVWRMLGRAGVPDALVDDALQEVFVVIYRRLGDYDGRAPLRAWIAGIARHVAARHARTEGRARRRADVFVPATAARAPDEELGLKQAVDLVDEILAGLPADQREVFVLADIEGWSAPEIAQALGCKLGTVYSRLHVARGRFAAAVESARAEGRRRAP